MRRAGEGRTRAKTIQLKDRCLASPPVARRQPNGHYVTDFFAEFEAGFGLDGQLVHAFPHRHERTSERMSINRSPNLHEAAGFEERGRFRPDDVAPAAFSGAFPELRRELNLYRLFGCHMLNLLGTPILQSTG